jgi:hypothetical protein
MRRIRLLGPAGVCAGRKGSGVFLPVTRHARRRMWAGEEVDAKWERPRQIRAMARGIKKADPPLSALGPILVSTLVSSPSDFSGFYRLHRFLRLLPSITYLFFTSMAWKRSSVRSRPGPPFLSTTYGYLFRGWRRWVSKRFDPQKEAYRIRRIP